MEIRQVTQDNNLWTKGSSNRDARDIHSVRHATGLLTHVDMVVSLNISDIENGFVYIQRHVSLHTLTKRRHLFRCINIIHISVTRQSNTKHRALVKTVVVKTRLLSLPSDTLERWIWRLGEVACINLILYTYHQWLKWIMQNKRHCYII